MNDVLYIFASSKALNTDSSGNFLWKLSRNTEKIFPNEFQVETKKTLLPLHIVAGLCLQIYLM